MIIKDNTESSTKCIAYEKFLQDIADELSFNYSTVSFGNLHKDNFVVSGIDNEKEVFESIFSNAKELIDRRKGKGRCRNILVIGSGATHDSYAAVPLGYKTKYQLGEKLHLQTLLGSSEQFKNKFEDEAARLLANKLGFIPDKSSKSFTDSDQFDFESFLLLMTKFFREHEVRNALHEMFNLRYAPCLFYEIAAHLFKHGFIDIIINFNFDEMLDQAIKEEMGSGNYYEIFSDGHCKDISEIVVDGRLKIPVYIKPHGTISHKSTLRFTKDHYFDLPIDIKSLLEQLFRGQLQTNSLAPCLDRINVITVGFNLESIEFNQILEKNKNKLRLYAITYKDIPKIFDNPEMEKTCKEDSKYRLLQTGLSTKPLNSPTEITLFLGDVFNDLYKVIINNFKEPYKPRGITRHLLFNDLFYSEDYRRKDSDSKPITPFKKLVELFKRTEFFKNRSIIELAIAISRGRGKIELRESMKDRLGEVYTLYRSFNEKEDKNSTPVSLYDLAEIFGLHEEFSFSRNVHNISDITEDEIKEDDELALKLFGTERENLMAINSLEPNYFARRIVFRLLNAKSTPESLKSAFQLKEKVQYDNRWNEEYINKICDYFEILYKYGNYQHIKARFNDPRLFVFDHFYKDQILHTNLSYTYRLNEVFICPEHWDYLFIVTDTGMVLNEYSKFLKQDLNESNKIYLITCQEAIKNKPGKYEPIDDILQNHLNKFNDNDKLKDRIIHKTLPYSDHHHHITIFLKKVNTNESIFELNKFPTVQIETNSKGEIENYIFVRSIYVYKRGFSNEINPLWVRGAFAFLKNPQTSRPNNYRADLLVKDHNMLLETFYAYHRKAISIEESDGKNLEFILPKEFHIPQNHTNNSVLDERKFKINNLFKFIKDTDPKNQYRKVSLPNTDTSSNSKPSSTSSDTEQQGEVS
ncbi:hypothetical protein GXP67_19570 [Rhodocytophaga rosea]|uniref:Uncharacterized protein n=1 Tax=Rhodocytophaga rosea TaxID=2704465 RepID=A0A6C0GL02_9BACT|nr:SIR2 family protein [Rhodocytophaga rosea]QHT68685.1 hypothetical protein GXP67_19570 [Rhodocytophaga rosea]